MLRQIPWRWVLLFSALLSACGGVGRKQKIEVGVSRRAAESDLFQLPPRQADRAGQLDTPLGAHESPERTHLPPIGALVRKKREESEKVASTRKRKYCWHGLGYRLPAYSFGLGKRAPYSFGLGKRAPYSFGLGKRTPYSFGLGKRAPYSFGLGKRTPYSFGLGKRAPYSFGLGKRTPYSFSLGKRRPYSFGLGKRFWSSWFDGPTTRELLKLKRPSYSFGLGKRSGPASQLWKTQPDGAGDSSMPAPVAAPQTELSAVTAGAEDCQGRLDSGAGHRWQELELTAPVSDRQEQTNWQPEVTA